MKRALPLCALLLVAAPALAGQPGLQSEVHGEIERFDFQARRSDEHQWVAHELERQRAFTGRQLQRLHFRQEVDRIALDRSFDLERTRLERQLVDQAGGSARASQEVHRRLNRVEIERDLRQMNREIRNTDPRPSRAARRHPVGVRHRGSPRAPRR